ncbi:hypothetical protein ACP4OV_014594 [Aristida adscensionis]
MAAAAAALDIAEIPFSDLALLLSPEEAAATDGDRLRRVLATVGAELGRGGPGLLAVAGVPRAGALRRRLLPLARRLALMDHPTRALLLKKHGLGSDVALKKLDRPVSSFAQLLRHSGDLHLLESMSSTTEGTTIGCTAQTTIDGFEDPGKSSDDDIEHLGELVKELGLCMMELGILVARACDMVIGGGQLEDSIAEFGTAKARLIHYHSEFDSIVIKGSSTKGKSWERKATVKPHQLYSQSSVSEGASRIDSDDEAAVTEGRENVSKDVSVSLSNLWQEWHYDYGIFTVLTAPLFSRASMGEECLMSQECHPPDGHTHLQLCSGRKMRSVRCSPESFIVQVGEAADILSGGKLRSTLHAVSRPLGFTDISRETFVVFLQPSWDKTLTSSCSSNAEDESSDDKDMATSDKSARSCYEDALMQEILKKIPPLSSRLKEGMTFAEFSRQTTRQYYGSGGIQQKG